MLEVAIILTVLSVVIYLTTLYFDRTELNWFSVIVSVAGLCAILIDDSLTADQTAIMIIPVIFIILMSILKASGIADRR